MAIRPKWNRRKGYPAQKPYEALDSKRYEALDSLLVLVAITLIYDAVTMEKRIIGRCQEPLDMRGATPEEMRQVSKEFRRLKRRYQDLDISCRR